MDTAPCFDDIFPVSSWTPPAEYDDQWSFVPSVSAGHWYAPFSPSHSHRYFPPFPCRYNHVCVRLTCLPKQKI
ncbi:hypothetical protein ACOMHN_046381 [Nucella lapillus]